MNYLTTQFPKAKAACLIAFSLLLGTNSTFAQSHNHTPFCIDFDNHVNGKWKVENPVPSTESRWGSFNELAKSNEEKTQKLVKNLLTKTYPKNSYEQQIADLYRSLVDVNARNAKGLTPLNNYFKLIDNAKTFNDLLVLKAIIPGLELPFSGGVDQDLMNSKIHSFYFDQTGLSLEERDFYLSTDEDKAKIRADFKKHLITFEKLLGKSEKQATKIADQIISLETDIAKAHLPKEDMRDPFKIYNKVSFKDLKKMAPTVDWDAYFKALGIQPYEMVLINVDMFKNIHKLINKHSVDSWKEYMKYHFAAGMGSFLTTEIENEVFNFYSTVLNGVKEQKPVEEKAIRRLNGLFGEPVGRLFAANYFSPKAKADVEHMIENMRTVYAERIQKLDWMSEATKKEALTKLSTFKYKIGYPEKWTDYSNLDIRADRVFENVIKINTFELKKNLQEYSKPVDPDKWDMNAHEVNAYYHPLKNEIAFPAGILQPPFYDAKGDVGANYGGIGAVIGHEFSHGFDDQGANFDADGNLRDWWTKEDKEKFQKLTKKLADQYNQYEILPNVKVNGEFTLGENIADQGGVLLSYYALLKEFENKPAPALVDGLNYKQRFFYGWATIWRNNSTEESIKQLISLDPHAPAKARINVTLSNLKEFYDAFDCDTPALPEENRVIIW